MSLEKRNYPLSEKDFDIYIFIDEEGNPWFKAKEIATILEYKNTTQAIRVNVDEIDRKDVSYLIADFKTPHNWQPNTIFISESGVYQLILKSKKKEALSFQKWVTSEVLPSIRKTWKYEVKEKTQNLELEYKKLVDALIVSNKGLILAQQDTENARIAAENARRDAENARQDTVALSNRIIDLAKDVVAKPKESKLLHTLTIHKCDDDEYIFTRCQQRSLKKAVKRLQEKKNSAKEIFSRKYVPNSVNILNCLKDYYKNLDISYEAKNNRIKMLDKKTTEELIMELKKILKFNE